MSKKLRSRLTSDRESGFDQPGLGKVSKRRKIGGNNNVPVDRISELPESIIHHIYGFMKCRKDPARTTILSKTWKNMFNSYLTFDFDQRWFRGSHGKHRRINSAALQKKKFRAYVDRSLATRLAPVPCIEKFRLSVTVPDVKIVDRLEKWIYSALSKNPKELAVRVKPGRLDMPIDLPIEVFKSESVASLKVSGYIYYDAECMAAITMPNLKVLSIKENVQLTDKVIKLFDSCCPLIEDLRLVDCTRITEIILPSLKNLRRIEVVDCFEVDHIKISAPGLELLTYKVENGQECKISLEGTENLRILNLENKALTDNELKALLSMSPLLEKLVLQNCIDLTMFTILSKSLRSLDISQCMGLKDVIIDAPNLRSLNYRGLKMPFSTMNVLGLREAKLCFNPVMNTRGLINDYLLLFKDFNRLKGFKLILFSNQYMTIYEEPYEACRVRCLYRNFELTASLASVGKIIDKWLRDYHGKGILLVSPSDQLIEIVL